MEENSNLIPLAISIQCYLCRDIFPCFATSTIYLNKEDFVEENPYSISYGINLENSEELARTLTRNGIVRLRSQLQKSRFIHRTEKEEHSFHFTDLIEHREKIEMIKELLIDKVGVL